MQKIMRPERGDLRTAKGSRSYSISSEVSSLPGQHLLAPPASINPEPAYVAISAASQLVSSELEIEEVTISASALAQLNSFLDHILFNILLAAKSTKLSLLRPAIVNVLKPKLGKAATSGADEELREYLGDEEDENEDEDAEADPDVEIKQEFDLELAWKLARLRCMVYSRLGDLEEDDEDEYIERENLDERGGRPRRFSSHPSRVSTASAIFLTSVIEFLAEQALAHAAQATQRKLSKTRVSQDAADPTGSLYFASDRIVVSDADMRQLGRDSPLQKLWRGWRHQVRSPTDPSLRSMSPESFVVPDHGRKASMGASDQFQEFEAVHRPTVAQVLHEDDPASVPLPMTDNDIEEIEIPESASTHDNEDLTKANGSSNKDRLRRPKSFEQFSSAAKPPIPVASDGPMASVEGRSVRPAIRHVRSRSLPTSPSLRPTTIRNNVPTSDSNGPESQIPESQIDSNEAEAADIEQPSIGATLQEPFDPSRDLTGGDGLSGGSLAAIAMPGSFPQGITADTDEGEEGTDISEESVDHYLPDSPSVSPIEPSADEVSANAGHVSTAIPSAAKGSQESNTISLVQSGSTNPPRVSSKDSIDNTSRRQLLPSALPDSVALIPGVVHGNHAKAVPSAPLGSTTSNATDTPDGNFPGARNMGAQKRQGQVIFPLESKDIRGSESSKSPQHSPNSSSSSKLLGFDREQHSAAQIGSNRAGVKRIYPVADTEDGITQFNRPSTSHSIKEQRPDSASSRYSSSIRGISARASLDTAVGTGQGTKASMEDEPNQSLDNLIRSKDTLKYTLTPQSVRQVEVSALFRRSGVSL